MPSDTFVSTTDAVVLRETLHIQNEDMIEPAGIIMEKEYIDFRYFIQLLMRKLILL